ncbi:MAG TPA: AI-2E family transporter [Lacipirellulaceae bacterium]|nr:AI-2E family transporter [Lacipirellulaceae bacterium]
MPAKQSTSSLFILVAMVTAVFALYVAKAILLPIALAILLTFLLTPLANRLERWRIPRVIAVVSLVGVSFAVMGALGWVVTNQLVQVTSELQETQHKKDLIDKLQRLRPHSPTIDKISNTLTDIRNSVIQGAATTNGNGKTDENTNDKSGASNSDDKSPPIKETAKGETNHPATAPEDDATTVVKRSGKRGQGKDSVEVTVVDQSTSTFDQVQDWLARLVEPLTTSGMVVVLVLFLLLDRENQRSRLIQLFGRTHMHATAEAFHDAAGRVGNYLRTLFLINAAYGFAAAAGLLIIGVPGAITWGVLGFSLRFIPYIGTWISASLPIIVSVALSPGWTQPVLVLGWYLVMELIFNNVVEPLVYGSTTGVSTIGVMLSAIFWTWLWGPIGLILSMPMTVCLLVAARYVPQLRFLTILLAEQSPASPAERTYQRLLAFDYHEPIKLAHKEVKESSLAAYYDNVLVPALALAENDRHLDVLNEDQSTFILESTGDIVDELGEASHRSLAQAQAHETKTAAAAGAERVNGPITSPTRILCIPLRDEADEIAAHMLAQLLVLEGYQASTGAAKSLTSELVDRVADTDSDVVIISALPPLQPRDTRLLWRRLRKQYPHLPIVVGFWTAVEQKESLAEPVEDAESRVVTNFAEAITNVRAMAAHIEVAAKTA